MSKISSAREIEWYFKPNVRAGQGVASTIDMFHVSGTLDKYITPDPNSIIQEVAIYPPQGKLYLDDIIKVYGPPEKVLFHEWSGGIVRVDLLYPDLGMVMALIIDDRDNSPNGIKVVVTSETEVWQVLFYATGLDFYFSETGIQQPVAEFNWKGYSAYP